MVSITLRPAVMAVGAGTIVISADVPEFLSGRGELIEFRARALGENCMAGIAVVRLDGKFSVFGLVQPIVTSETARPDHVTDVVGIRAPVGFHLREEIVLVNLLHRRNGVLNSRVVGVTGVQPAGDAILGTVVIGIISR